MVGVKALDLYADPKQSKLLLDRLKVDGSAVQDYEITFVKKDSTSFDALFTLHATTHDDAPSMFFWVYDISKFKVMQNQKVELERELNQAQKLEAVGQLAGGIAHEINTPSQYVWDNLRFLSTSHVELTSLLIQCLEVIHELKDTEGMSDKIKDIDDLCDSVDLEFLLGEVPIATSQAITGISEIARLVRAMKEFSHPGNAEKSFMDLNHMIENTVTISRNEWKHLATVEFSFDMQLPRVCCLPGDLNQVFLNIVVNAAHAIDSNSKEVEGEIHISTKVDGVFVVVSISDNGSGIPKSIQQNIFEPFFTTKDVGKGTGQGLAIARSIIVKKHHGTICCDSVEGEGTVFTIRLPIDGEGV